MKKYLCLNLVILGLLSSCMPKSPSSSSGSSSTNSSPVSGNGGGLTGTTPTASPTYTVPPTYTPNTNCGDPIGDCTGTTWVFQKQGIVKIGRGYNSSDTALTSWDSSTESALMGSNSPFITDGRLRLRVKVNQKPDKVSCGATGANGFTYTKMKFQLSVKKFGDTGTILSQDYGPINVNSTSDIIEVPVATYPSANPYIVNIKNVRTDAYCLWTTYSSWNIEYCKNNPAWCNCTAESPDPTNCWSVDLQVVNDRTNNFK